MSAWAVTKPRHNIREPAGPADMGKSSPKKVVVSRDGPYKVSGGAPLSMQIITPNREGLSWDWKKAKDFEAKEDYDLCRCGHSKNKPFCDGSHAKVRFSGTETATRRPVIRQAEVFAGETLLLSDAEELCAFARFCDPGGKIWSVIEEPGQDSRRLAIREANHCPAGRLMVHDKKSGKEIEEKLP